MAKKEVTREMSEAIIKDMATPSFKRDFINLIRCRYPIFYVTTHEEKRFLQFINHFSRVNGRVCFRWNSFEGLKDHVSGDIVGGVSKDLKGNALAVLDHIIDDARSYENSKTAVASLDAKKIKGIIYVLCDFFRFINEAPDIERRLRVIANLSTIVTVVLTGPYYKTTEVLENLIPVIDFPYANPNEIRHALYDVVNCAEEHIPDIREATKEREEELIAAVSGLTIPEAQTAFSKSIVSCKGWHIPTILEEKKQIINKTGLLEFFNKTVPLEEIGGLKNLIGWIRKRQKSFSKEAEEYGLCKPRGLLLVGLPGCGKSYCCKAISGSWEMPLLRLDFGKLFASYVGHSERNARDAIKLAEAIAPTILWIDEIEKGISGQKSSGKLDSGVTSRVLSTFLTWMQEKESPVFVVATANDQEAIPPEFLRAGRFDEIFFVDLPNREEREEIFHVLLAKRKVNQEVFDLHRLSTISEGYSGAEIEKAIDDAMLIGFSENKRSIDNDDIATALNNFFPLSVMREGEFTDLREWAEKRCRKANASITETPDSGLGLKRDLEIT